MKPIDRRRFVSESANQVAGLAAGASLLASASPAAAKSANDKVVLALLGAGGRGTGVAAGFAARKDAEIGYVCDLHDDRLASACKTIATHQGREPKALKEMRRLFDAKDLDAVIVATPDHWHALATILACQAGKDVYVEKPPSHNIWEGRKMVEAARKYRRIVQVGTQNRSAPYNLAARDYIKSGKLGDIHFCKVFNMKAGGQFRLPADDKPPSGFDWEAWLGTAPARPHNSTIFKGGWHHYWTYSGGDFANDGIHQLDLAMMLLGDPELPRSVYGTAGRFAFQDDQEVPDTQVVTYEFPKLIVTFELSLYTPYMEKIATDIRNASDVFPFWPQCGTRIELYGSKGIMYMGRHGGGWQVYTKPKRQSRPGELVAQFKGRPGDHPHQDDFIASIKSRKRPNADIEIGHKSAVLVHLGNIAHQVGNQKLVFDPETETFAGNEAANRLRRRENRTKYEVPEQV
jgi:predicted dehydrogenase